MLECVNALNAQLQVGATEAEEIGVEHLLRNVKDATISTLSTEVGGWMRGRACVCGGAWVSEGVYVRERGWPAGLPAVHSSCGQH